MFVKNGNYSYVTTPTNKRANASLIVKDLGGDKVRAYPAGLVFEGRSVLIGGSSITLLKYSRGIVSVIVYEVLTNGYPRLKRVARKHVVIAATTFYSTPNPFFWQVDDHSILNLKTMAVIDCGIYKKFVLTHNLKNLWSAVANHNALILQENGGDRCMLIDMCRRGHYTVVPRVTFDYASTPVRASVGGVCLSQYVRDCVLTDPAAAGLDDDAPAVAAAKARAAEPLTVPEPPVTRVCRVKCGLLPPGMISMQCEINGDLYFGTFIYVPMEVFYNVEMLCEAVNEAISAAGYEWATFRVECFADRALALLDVHDGPIVEFILKRIVRG